LGLFTLPFYSSISWHTFQASREVTKYLTVEVGYTEVAYQEVAIITPHTSIINVICTIWHRNSDTALLSLTEILARRAYFNNGGEAQPVCIE
jgi:hypothetical protein